MKQRLRLAVLMALAVAGMLPAAAQTTITDASGLNAMAADGNYVITQDITISGNYTTKASFTGTLTAQAKADGTYPVITGLNVPLFTTATDATISNIMLKSVTISQAGYVGAIACTANGTTRIYNCGILPTTYEHASTGRSQVGSTGVDGDIPSYCGSLVGFLDGTARVINCFSYANITSGATKAGIVGYNNFASRVGTTGDPAVSNIHTMVMNCMFYGDITSGGDIYPIYGGLEISNWEKKNNVERKLNNYNYFLYEAPFSQNGLIAAAKYNCALAAEERYLVRFEFYRYLLNSTRELASWYVFGSVQTDAHTKMAKWVLDKHLAPYPILKVQGTYPSVVNYDPVNTFDSESGNNVARSSVTERNKGKNLGTLTVNISVGSNAPTGAGIKSGKNQITLQRTDKDVDDYNFCYDKVQLPYYNEVGTGNCTYNKVVTGWKITGMTGGTKGTFTAANQWGGYNFADRTTYAKDLYSGSSSTDHSGRVFSQGAYFEVPEGVTAITIEPYWGTAAYLSDANYDCWGYATSSGVSDFGTHYVNKQTYSICGNTQKVYTSFGDALGSLSGTTVYDNAIVLVGNFHQKDSPANSTKPFTIMSIDLDEDNEPDYSFIYNSGKQKQISPIRFDFVNVPGTAMAHKMTSTNYMGIMGNHKWRGWLEVTNTTFIRFSQLEYDDKGSKAVNSPVILLGGVVEQMVSTNGNNEPLISTPYIHVGGNVWFKMFNNGCHIDKTAVTTPRIPISVTGGDYEKFYLSGYFQPDAPAVADNAECYISGGRFGELAGSGQELINGDVTWDINHADITNFYGGGINDKNPITGAITVTIKNSHVGVYCGGPKFGNMASGKEVHTTATNCTFGTYFGAGYGGTSLVRRNTFNEYQTLNYNWTSISSEFVSGTNKRGTYNSSYGIAVNYEYENFEGSNDKTVGRFYVNYASLSLAQTNDVHSTLTGCTVTGSFYGGGSLGKVAGTANSTLTDCTVGGSVFGAGYSATVPTVTVYDAAVFSTIPGYSSETGVFKKGVPPASTEYPWIHKDQVNSSASAFDGTNNEIYTEINFADLGRVAQNVNLTITSTAAGTTTVAGSVYGGGDMSPVTGTTNVILEGDVRVTGNVFAGGNENEVEDATHLTLQNLSGPSSQVQVGGSVYGGGNLADVGGATLDILEGTITQNVFGGGKGNDTKAPEVNGPVTVNIGATDGATTPPTYSGNATINGSVYGCNDANGSPKQNVDVHIYSTARGGHKEASYTGNDAEYALAEVFGGGNRADYSPSIAETPYKTSVTIFGCENTVKDIYGGGNAAAAKQCAVTIWGGRHDRVFAGGNGAGEGNPGADIGTGGTSLTINAGIINQVFGGSNEKGDIEGPIYVTVAHPNSQCGDDADVAEQIGEFFGGSNKVATGTDAHPVTITTTIECGTGTFSAVYGGSNQANIIGNVTLNIKGGTIGTVYGGSKGVKAAAAQGTEGQEGYVPAVAAVEAHILDARNDDTEHTPKNVAGNVTLNLFGGTITDAFGGSNQNGNIEGAITVNVFDLEGACRLNITGNIYGAGNVTPYTPLAYATNGTKTTPKVNLIHIANANGIGGSVYGGGLGADAQVTAKPRVNIGYDAANMSSLITSLTTGIQNPPTTYTMRVAGSVYGGGKEAPVAGNENGRTHVRVNAGSTVDHNVFGGGDEATVSGRSSVDMVGGTVTEDIFGGGNQANVGSTLVSMSGGSVRKAFGGGNNVTDGGVGGAVAVNISGSAAISDGLYGGCNTNGTVTGNIAVAVNGGNIGAAQVGEIGDANYAAEVRADIHGGGYGADTKTGADVEVSIGPAGDGTGPTVYGDVYGGSALGSVGNTSEAVNAEKHTYVTMNKGTVNGSIFGGGLGESGDGNVAKGRVWTPVVVTVNEGTVTGSVYGCNNTNGAPRSTVAVVVAGGTVANVYGGGNNAAYTSPDASSASPLVTIKGTGKVGHLDGNGDLVSGTGNVFGGGNNAIVTGSSAVKLQGGATVRGNAFGGGNNGAVTGSSSVTIQD